MARVRWLDPDRHPGPGSTIGATAVFVLGNDAEVMPGWPATGQHFSVMLALTDSPSATNDAESKVDFLDRETVADYVRENAVFLVMAGPKPIAEARIAAVLWTPRPQPPPQRPTGPE
jgi:hypothetical protein